MIPAAPLLLAGWIAAAPQAKTVGVLVLAGEGGRETAQAVAGVRKDLGPRYHVETAQSADAKSIQAAVSRLESRRVAKIVAVPLLLCSHSAEMDQNRYLFGIRRDPPADFQAGPHSRRGFSPAPRVRGLKPLVLAQALDDSDALVAVMSDRVAEVSRGGAKESLLLVASAPGADVKNSQLTGTLKLAAGKIQRKAGIARVETFVIRDDGTQADRDFDRDALRKLAMGLSRDSRLIVAPLSLGGGGLEARLAKTLAGVFMRSTRGLLPDDRIGAWAKAAVEAGVKLPDMRTFKQSGRLQAGRGAP